MKSLLLLFFIPAAVCAMDMDVDTMPSEESTLSNNSSGESFWQAAGWYTPRKSTDEGRRYTLNTIQQELTNTLQKIQNCSDHLPSNQMNTVKAQLNMWLSAITNGLLSLNSPGECIAIDAALETYANQEQAIGKAVTSLEQALQPGNNSNPVDALETLMNSLSVTSLEEEIKFDNLSLGN